MDSLNKQTSFRGSLMPFLQERLAAGQNICYVRFRGVSMLPMLRQGKDSVDLAPLPKRLKKYDLPVYLRSDGQYVMHRVIKVKENYYVCLGDNTIEYEYIYPEQLIGVVCAFHRGEHKIEVNNFWYQMYCRVWWGIRPLRMLLKRAKLLVAKILKRKKHGY